MSRKIKCCICGKEIDRMLGNNPDPVKKRGSCCSECDETIVIPARAKEYYENKENITRIQRILRG